MPTLADRQTLPQPPPLIAIADAPLWEDPLRRHAFAFAVGRLASAFRRHPGQIGLQLRLHGCTAEQWLETLAELHWLRDFGLRLGISAPKQPTAELFGDLAAQLTALERAGVAWVQIGEDDAQAWSPALREPMGRVALARSCHDLEGVGQALKSGAAWVSLSPLLSTPSKPGVQPLGWGLLQQAAAMYPGQIVALGGIGAREAAEVWRLGASVAVLRAWQDQPSELAAALRAAY